ncbi:DUF4230 domain-containing protein [Tsuneonella sp. HG222]
MVDDTLNRPASETLRPLPEARREPALARVQMVPWLLFIVMLAVAAWLAWRAFFYQAEGDPVASAMLAFEKQNSLTVFSSRFEVVAESTDQRGPLGLPVLKSRQAMIVPATVEYRVNLASVGRDRMQWDDGSDTLRVQLPPLQTSIPNLDEKSARLFTDGNFVTGGAAQDLARNNSAQAERKASEFARNAEILALAKTAAKEAIRQNLTIPLQVAGYGDVKVEVAFDGDVAQ